MPAYDCTSIQLYVCVCVCLYGVFFVCAEFDAAHTATQPPPPHVSRDASTVSHSRPRSEVADLDSRSGVLTASWLDSEGVD